MFENLSSLLNQLDSYSVDTRAFADIRQSTLLNGQRVVEAYNAAGLHLTFLPDRGLDIWTARYKGVPLTWISPGSPYSPDHALSWLDQFNGGLLTTCGLTHHGPPETDSVTGEIHELHGRYSRLKAQNVHINRVHHSRDLELKGTIWQTSLFGTQIEVQRTYRLAFAEPLLTVTDQITNRGDETTPLMILYHVNLGFPLVREGAELVIASDVYPRDEVASTGIDRWHLYDGPTPSYAEQVFFHHLLANEDLSTSAAMLNEDFGLLLRWNAAELPYLTQWKNTRSGRYVCGVEPGIGLPDGQNANREYGRLDSLLPGETRTVRLMLRVLDHPAELDDYRRESEQLRENGSLVQGCNLRPYSNPA